MPETVRLVEDIVRGQIIEIVILCCGYCSLQVTRARLLTHIRSSRFLSAEDLIFLIRDDRGKVNRLRTYLSWKDVRKKAKEEEDGDVDVEETGAEHWSALSSHQTRRTRKAGSLSSSSRGSSSPPFPTFCARFQRSRTGTRKRRKKTMTSSKRIRTACNVSE